MRIVVLLLLTMLASCAGRPAEKPVRSEFADAVHLAELKIKKLEEASGLAASAVNEGMFWTHNDSGNPAELFLVDKKLNTRLVCVFQGVENRDWEDIAVGPGPEEGKSYIYIGEIGDNLAVYPFKVVYRVEEPVAEDGKQEVTITKFDRIFFRLPDKRKDTETLMVDPKTKDLLIISKRENPVYLYKLPYPQTLTDTMVADMVCPIPLTQIVSGDVSPDRTEILLKNYQNVFFWNINGDEPLSKTLSRPATMLSYDEEPQGEAITFARDGSGYYTISEKAKGEKVYLNFYQRK
jgi:hypothetical protein